MAKEFHYFNNGVKIQDWEINNWLRGCKDQILSGNKYSCTSSGDTHVSANRFDSGTVDFVVANSSGYSRVSFYSNDEEIKKWIPNYSRPA